MTPDQRSGVRKVLVDFLDWETSYPEQGWGDAGAANRDYDLLAAEIIKVLEGNPGVPDLQRGSASYNPDLAEVDRHRWFWDGDDPYVVCCCGEQRDALTGSVVKRGRGHAE